ncbi:hypothetical protein ACFQ6N_02420 [Kitasatospora sp. NPDC056446]|uniref:hypothetical protein n=1 Tax=Kitasatospora sp. NPDC056446 TaxID=3345819 RepID=UPI0036AC9C51
MVRGRGLRRFGAAVVLAGLVTGCGGSGGGGGHDAALAEPALPAVLTEPPDGAAVPLPLDGYAVSGADSALIFQAREAATRTCMKGKGFDYTPAVLPAAPPPSPLDPDFLGILSATAARLTGYHRPPPPAGQVTAQQQQQGGDGPEYRKALEGAGGKPGTAADPTADRGCMGAFDKQLGGALAAPAKDDVVGGLRAQAYDHATGDSQVKAAVTKWAGCMTAQGYHYATPAAAGSAAWPDPVAQQEKDTAVADMVCKAQAQLLGTWYAVEAGYQTELIGRNESALQGIKDRVTQRVAAAKKALGEG